MSGVTSTVDVECPVVPDFPFIGSIIALEEGENEQNSATSTHFRLELSSFPVHVLS